MNPLSLRVRQGISSSVPCEALVRPHPFFPADLTFFPLLALTASNQKCHVVDKIFIRFPVLFLHFVELHKIEESIKVVSDLNFRWSFCCSANEHTLLSLKPTLNIAVGIVEISFQNTERPFIVLKGGFSITEEL